MRNIRLIVTTVVLIGAGSVGQAEAAANSDIVVASAAQSATGKANNGRDPDARPVRCDGPKARTSDLCAQWSAADAAWKIGTIGNVVGLLTLLAAVSAAIFAGIAARHARAANRIAENIGQAQVRSYLWVKDVQLRFDDQGTPLISMVVINAGQSPARNVRWSFVMSVRNITDNWNWAHPLSAPIISRDIPAQHSELFAAEIPVGEPIDQGTLSDLLLGPNLEIKLQAILTFVDVFGKEFSESWSFRAMKPVGLNEDLALNPDLSPPPAQG